MKSFAEAAGKTKGEIDPKDNMQNDPGAMYWVEDSEIEDQNRTLSEEDDGVIHYCVDVVELLLS